MLSPSLLGVLLALGALVSWSLAPFFFTAAGRRIGPFTTNTLRLTVGAAALLALCLPSLLSAGAPPLRPALLLAVSGVIGLSIGDHFLYTSWQRIGPERTSLVLTLAPAATAAIAWFALDEALSPAQLGGIVLVLAGVAAAATARHVGHAGGPWSRAGDAVLAALFQAAGSVMARQAFLEAPDFPVVEAAFLRVAAGAAGLWVAAAAGKSLRPTLAAVRDGHAMRRLLVGAFFGPIAGMIFYVSALRLQPAGVVTTLTFMTPLLIVPLGAWRYGTAVGTRALTGGAAALAGVILLGWASTG